MRGDFFVNQQVPRIFLVSLPAHKAFRFKNLGPFATHESIYAMSWRKAITMSELTRMVLDPRRFIRAPRSETRIHLAPDDLCKGD